MKKIAIIISHPIQHFCPQYASYAALPNVQIKVFFASSLGFKPYFDKNFNAEISWSALYLEKFSHVFLNDGKAISSSARLDAPDLDSALNSFNPDVLIVNGYFQKYQRRAKKWALQHKKRVLYIADSELNQKRSFLKRMIKWPYLYNYFRSIDFFMSVGDSNEKFYRVHGISSKKIVRTCFPIDLNLYSPSYHKKETLRRDYRTIKEINSEDIVLATVGKLVSWKSQQDVIRGLRIIEKARPDLRFNYLLAGTGPEMENLTREASLLQHNKVIFCGFVNPDELPLLYASADIYIHPAKIEPHSLAISEAIYMGCPVILSDRCGSYGEKDDVFIGQNGFVYPWNNISALSDNILQLVANPDLMKVFSNASHQRAEKFQELAHGKALTQIISKIP